jgi:TolA-binding protein
VRDRIEDLSIHARRGELGESALRQLALALECSREARLFHEAGCEFDKSDSVLAGDDEIARRVISRVLKLRDGKRRRRRRSYRFGLAMVAWTAAAAAAAPLLVGSELIRPSTYENRELAKLQPSSKGYQSESLVAATRPVRQLSQPDTEQEPDSANTHSPGELRIERHRTRPSIQAVNSPSRELNSSPQIFAEANRLRRIGRPSDAIKQYTALQQQFPNSAEACAANLALGMLRLQGGWAQAALGHFRRYLDSNSAGDLVPEALWGQAQALDSLGRHGAARQSYSTLLRRYPESAYASAARAKLQVEP